MKLGIYQFKKGNFDKVFHDFLVLEFFKIKLTSTRFKLSLKFLLTAKEQPENKN